MPGSRAPKVTVLIVNWNGRRFLRGLFTSLLATDYPGLDVLVVDNASTDGSREVLRQAAVESPKVRILLLDRNAGFAGGNNEGLRRVPGNTEYVCFLNNDVVVERDWLRVLVDFLEAHADVGIVQPKLLKLGDPGRIDRAAVTVDRMGYDAYDLFTERRDGPDLGEPREVFSVSGAAFLVRRRLIDAIAFEGDVFDPSYFTYFEETDLCWRARLAGQRVWFCPASRVYHFRGGTTRPGGRLPASLVFHHTKNRMAALLKNYDAAHVAVWFPTLVLAESLRAFVTVFTNREHSFGIVRGLGWVLENRQGILARRAFVQRAVRRVSDREATALMAFPNPSALIRNYLDLYRGALGPPTS